MIFPFLPDYALHRACHECHYWFDELIVGPHIAHLKIVLLLFRLQHKSICLIDNCAQLCLE